MTRLRQHWTMARPPGQWGRVCPWRRTNAPRRQTVSKRRMARLQHRSHLLHPALLPRPTHSHARWRGTWQLRGDELQASGRSPSALVPLFLNCLCPFAHWKQGRGSGQRRGGAAAFFPARREACGTQSPRAARQSPRAARLGPAHRVGARGLLQTVRTCLDSSTRPRCSEDGAFNFH